MTHRELNLWAIFHNSVLFRDFFVPEAWGEEYYRTRYYQYPMALAENAVVLGGRSTGKSKDLEFQEVQDCINDFDQQSLITTFRSLHIKARFEAIIGYFYKVAYFRAFIKRIVRQNPIWQLDLKNGHTLYGISVGDDPQCVNIQGKHPTKRKGEEFSFYPQAAFIKFQEAADPRGTTDRYTGVVDGREDTPFRRLDTKISRFKNHRFHLSRRFDPNFDQETKEDRIDAFGGEDSDDFKQQIDSLWGMPRWGAWDIEAIMANMIQDEKNPKHKPVVITISAKDYAGKIPEELLYGLPKAEFGADVYLVMDAGYSQPSCVLIFANSGKEWEQVVRIMLTNKMIADDQAEIVDYIADFYKAGTISIDCTSAEGRNVSHAFKNSKRIEYEKKNYSDRIIEVYFNGSSVVGYEYDEKKKEPVEKKEDNKILSANTLIRMFAKKDFVLPYDIDILADFNKESWVKNESTGKTLLRVPHNVHIPEAFRCFSFAYWKKNVEGTITKYEEENAGFALPERLAPIPLWN